MEGMFAVKPLSRMEEDEHETFGRHFVPHLIIATSFVGTFFPYLHFIVIKELY